MRHLFAVIVFCVLATPVEAQCVSAAPAPGWVCLNGGWLPPGHPLLGVTTPVGPAPGLSAQVIPLWPPSFDSTDPINGWIINKANRGEPLPSGEVWFNPPLRLKAARALKSYGITILRPLTNVGGPLVTIESIHNSTLDYPARLLVQDVHLVCAGFFQTGWAFTAASVTFDRVTTSGCGEGGRVVFGVNIVFRDCDWNGNITGLLLSGTPGASITTIRFEGNRFAGNSNAGLVIWRGMGITIDSNTIFKSNAGWGLQVLPQDGVPLVDVQVRDSWFESNSGHIYDPQRRITASGSTSGRSREMTIEAQTLLAIGIPAAGVIVWLVRLEGKILMNEQRTSAIEENVQYIRERIDAALNGTTHITKKRATD